MQYHLVDAFAERAFAGNPAAVMILTDPIPDDLMQGIASEINLSETAFVRKQGDVYTLRWFSPTTEIDLCGHATLAAAHVLWEEGVLHQNQTVTFDTKSGILTARKADDHITMDFPLETPWATPCPQELRDALNIDPIYIGRNRFDYLVEVESEAVVKNTAPDLNACRKIDCRGIIITSRSENGCYDFISRFFAPRAGIPEDPVTGSAHCALGPYWSRKTGKSKLIGYQASGRGGIVKVCVTDDKAILGGKALTVARGKFVI